MATASTAVASDPIQYEVNDQIATIWLNRPEVKNCVNWELLTQMAERVEEAAEDPDVRVVLFRGRGNTFCAGADLRMLGSEFVGTSKPGKEWPAEASCQVDVHDPRSRLEEM